MPRTVFEQCVFALSPMRERDVTAQVQLTDSITELSSNDHFIMMGQNLQIGPRIPEPDNEVINTHLIESDRG